jgi:hypothetical protein
MSIIPHLSELIDGVTWAINKDLPQIWAQFVSLTLHKVDIDRALLQSVGHHPEVPDEPIAV